MDRIQCVSLPRCGHNLLTRHLQKYFRSDLQCEAAPRKRFAFLSDKQIEPAANHCSDQIETFHYCEYYYACRSSPCTNPDNTFQKSHDFELTLPVQRNQKHIVQIREPVGFLISWFEMRLLKGREKDTHDGFRDFVNRNQSYLNGFRKKWIEADLPSRLILKYEDYLGNPVEQLSNVINFFNPANDIDIDRIKSATVDVQSAKDNSKFRFIETAKKEILANENFAA